jgi:hypothetical protein
MGWSDVNRNWLPLPHLPIEELSENLWRIQGSLPNMGLKRVMTVARLANDDLVIHNGIALDDQSMARLEAWGRPAWLLVPSAYHRLDAPAFAARYPEMRVLCPAGARGKVAKVVDVHGTADAFPADDAVQLQPVEGIKNAEDVLMVTSSDGTTLVFTDLIFNMPHGTGMNGWFFRYLTASTGGPRISRMVRLFLIADKRALRAHLERLASLPNLVRVIVSHHRMITDDPAGTLRAVAATL